MKALALGLFALVAGCATVDVYHYQSRPLPAGSAPLAIVSWSLQDLRNVSWSYGEPDPDPSRRAQLAATVRGISGLPTQRVLNGLPLNLTYGEISEGVRMVTESGGVWTVYIYDREERLVQLEFSNYAAARLFLDAAAALASQPAETIDVASIKG